MRALPLLPVALLLALASAPSASAAEAPLAGERLTAVLKSDKAWCSGWREEDQSCEEIVFLDAKDGQITQTRRYRIAEDLDLHMVIRETVTLERDRLCSTYRFAELDVVVLADGQPAPAEQTLAAMALVAGAMADVEGKKACEAFTRDDATGDIHSRVTLDGEAAPEFDSDYRLLAPDARIKLRPLFEDTETSTIA
jgi:hypothetical protein